MRSSSLAAALFVVLAAALAFVPGAAAAVSTTTKPKLVGPPSSSSSEVDVPAGTRPPQIARFAVLVYSMNRGAKLRYVGVSADSDVQPHQGGVRYRMVVTAADAATGAAAQYKVLVWGIPGSYQWMLLEFKKIDN